MSPAERERRSNASRRPPWQWVALFALGLCCAASIAALEFDLSALRDAGSRAEAWARLSTFLGAFGAPDLSAERLGQGLSLSLSTFSIALWGSGLGLVLGYTLALFASRAVWLGESRPGAGYAVRRVVLELARLALDVLRGVPDFAWALLILTVPGPGAVTGVLAIALGVAGILGRIFSELWDAVPARRYEALRANGASRAQVFLYAVQPLCARPMLSFGLMRLECSVRNASVIGVVGGGGLGAQLFEEFNFGNYAGVVTLLLFLLALTASTDLASNFLRHHLRTDPTRSGITVTGAATGHGNSQRRRTWALLGCFGAAIATLAAMTPDLLRAGSELWRVEWAWIGGQLAQLFHPQLEARSWIEAAVSCRVPLAIGFLATLIGVVGAGWLAYPGSWAFQIDSRQFTGEFASPWTRFLRAALLVVARATTLVLRSIPEVAWLFILAAFFRIGALPGILAVGVHSIGVLGRVFVESIDNQAYRPFEQTFHGSRATAFLYSAFPSSVREWSSYAFVQFEANVRAGVVVGIIGIGGLGERFHTSVQNFNLERASVFLIAMVLMTTIFDRLSRALKLGANALG